MRGKNKKQTIRKVIWRPAREQRRGRWRVKALVRLYRRKWRTTPFHEKINIAVGMSSFFIGIMAIVLTALSLRMGNRQADIAEMQMRILQKQLALDAQLMVVGEAPKSGSGITWSIKNRGLGPKRFRYAVVSSQFMPSLGLSCQGIDGATVSVGEGGSHTFLSFSRLTEVPGETSVPFVHCEVSTPAGRVGHHGFPLTWEIYAEDDETFKSVESSSFWVVMPKLK